MNHLAARLRYWTGLLSRPGLAGAGLLAAAAAAWFSLVLPAQHRAASLAEQEAAVAAAEAARKDAPPPPPGPDAQLANFYRTFPGGRTTPDWLQKMFDAAQEQGLELAQGEYLLQEDRSGRLAQYRITFPLKGGYPQLRRFMAAVLAQVPSASLEAASFKREKIADATVEARISFLLFLERKP